MCWFIWFWLCYQEMFRACYPCAHWVSSSSEIKCSQFIGLFCPSVFLIKCTSSTDIAEYLSHEHPTPIIGPTFSKLASSEDVGKFVCNSNWCENYRQWVRPGINDQLRDRRPRTKVEQQFLHQFNQLTWQTFQSVYLFSREALLLFRGFNISYQNSFWEPRCYLLECSIKRREE